MASYSYLANSPLVGQIAFADNGAVRMTTTKQYDYLNRLTTISSGTGVSPVSSFRYAYNQANQHTQVTNADIIATNNGNLLVSQIPETFGYDADGNQTNSGRWAITWDAENRAISFASLSSTPMASQRKVDCAYDFQGRRIQKIVSTSTGSAWIAISTNRFVYDGWNVVGILDGNDNLLYSFAWGMDLSGSPQGAGGVGGLLSMTAYAGPNAGSYDYTYDGNGNVAALVNAANGSMAGQWECDPFGGILRASGSLSAINPLLLSKKYCDSETCLYYYGARYYDPELGRFIQPDTEIPDLANQQSYNRYSYCVNDPLRYNDPTGHWGQEAADWWSGTVNGGANYISASPSHWVWNGTAGTVSSLVGGVAEPLRLGSSAGAVSGNPNATAGQIAIAGVQEISRAAAIVPVEAAIGKGTGALVGSLTGGAESEAAAATTTTSAAGGRLGSQATRDQVAGVAGKLEQNGWEITGGGGKLPEEYIPGPGGARKGSSYPDITATKNGEPLRMNTVDTRANGVTPTTREANNAARIRSQKPGDTLILVPQSN